MNHYLYIVIELIFIVTAVIFSVLILRQGSVVNTKQLVYQLVIMSMACISLVALIIGSSIEQDWGMIVVGIISLACLLRLVAYNINNISLLKRLRTTTDDKTGECKKIDGVNRKEWSHSCKK